MPPPITPLELTLRPTTTGEFEIGSLSQDVLGDMDELRVETVTRSADWIKTSFNNQDDATPGAGNFIKSLSVDENACGYSYQRSIVIDSSKVGLPASTGTLPDDTNPYPFPLKRGLRNFGHVPGRSHYADPSYCALHERGSLCQILQD